MIPVKTVLLVIVVLVTVYRQASAVGTMCGNSNECLPTEECVMNFDFDMPCQKGLCVCKRDFIVDDRGVCQRIVSRKLNDSCSNNTYEQLPANAWCNERSIVACSLEYVASGNACVRPTSNPGAPPVVYNQVPEGGPCQKRSDCMGDMQCGDGGARYVCLCRALYMRFDVAKNRCIRREFGDPCTRDIECNVYATPYYNWLNSFEGYNYIGGRCVRGRCECSINGINETRISYLQGNNTVVTKSICLVAGASIAKRGERCTLNPIGHSFSTMTMACETGTVCYQCPEEYNMENYGVSIGTCRIPKNVAAVDLQRQSDSNYYLRQTGNNIPAGYDQYGYSITAPTSTLMPPSTEPVQIKKVGSVCATNADCGTNEICNTATNVDTPCTRGICTCKPCYAVDPYFNVCYPIQYRGLNELCSESPIEILPKNTVCLLGYVRCKKGYMPPTVGDDCVRQRGVGGYGDWCAYDANCLPSLTCNRYYAMCECTESYQTWDNATQSCINREFGDPCSDEADCRVAGGDWSGYTYAGGTCILGRCDCATYNMKVSIGYVDQVSGTLKTKFACVNNASTINLSKGARCTLDPIKYSNNWDLKICGTSNMCYRCPEDYSILGQQSTGDGLCRAFSRTPPQPNCDAFLTTTASIPNFGN